MPISRIRTADVFDMTHLNPGEKEQGINIVCATSDNGKNPDPKSVAGQIAQLFSPDFRAFPEGSQPLGHVYHRERMIDTVSGPIRSRFFGIVANMKKGGGNLDWQGSEVSVAKGLQTIYDDGLVSDPGHRESISREGLFELAQIADMDPEVRMRKIIEITRKVQAAIDPIVRIVFIGTGPAGRRDDADYIRILESMNNSAPNLHLYLRGEEEQKSVARVIRLNPSLRNYAPLASYGEIRLAA